MPWQQQLNIAQTQVLKHIPSKLILHHANIVHLGARGLQLTFAYTCILENCFQLDLNSTTPALTGPVCYQRGLSLKTSL